MGGGGGGKGKGEGKERGGIYSFRENTRPGWGPTAGSRTRCDAGAAQPRGSLIFFNSFLLVFLILYYCIFILLGKSSLAEGSGGTYPGYPVR